MEESTSFLKKNRKLLIPAGFATVSAKCFKESKFFCFFLFTKRRSCFTFCVSKRTLGALQYDLPYVRPAGLEADLAIAEVEFPKPLETLVILRR